MDPLTPDFDQLPDPRDPSLTEATLRWLAGTFTAGWDILKQAAVSAAIAAATGTRQSLETWERIQARAARPAESDVLMDMNYRSAMLGLCLAAVVLTAFATEAFLRLGYVVSFELQRAKETRSKGSDPQVDNALKKFDEAKPVQKLRLLRTRVGCSENAPADDAVLRLLTYRNAIAHDSPVVTLSSGEGQPAFPKARARPQSIEPYESLTTEHRPIRLKHVIASINAHDHFVRHALDSAPELRWSAETGALGGPSVAISDALPGAPWWSQLGILSDHWEKGPESSRATPKEFHEFRADFARRAKVKLVDDTRAV